jgi:hypothetical protein
MWVGAPPPLAVPPCSSAAPGPDREAAAPVLRCHQVVCRPAGGGGRGDAGIARAARRRQPQGRAWLLQYLLFLLLWQPLPVLYDPSVEYVSSFTSRKASGPASAGSGQVPARRRFHLSSLWHSGWGPTPSPCHEIDCSRC